MRCCDNCIISFTGPFAVPKYRKSSIPLISGSRSQLMKTGQTSAKYLPALLLAIFLRHIYIDDADYAAKAVTNRIRVK